MPLCKLLTVAAGLLIAAGLPARGGEPAKEKVKDEELRQELLRRMQEDQDARKAFLEELRQAKGADADPAKKLEGPAAKRLREIDRRNTARLKEILDRHGWPGKTLVGTQAAHAAWLLVQHADHDLPFQKRCLALLAEAVTRGEAVAQDLAYLTDRVRVAEKKEQVYGTQLRQEGGTFKPQPIEDEANVDRRRRQVGLPPLAEYLKLSEALLKGKVKGK
jgi:hypothetical protein